jgi:RNA polymerase sigma-54 factor
MGVRQRLEQRLRLAPQILQSIEILQLPLMALQERIEQEQSENPALELLSDAESTEVRADEQRPENLEEERAAGPEEDFGRIDDLSEDFGEYFWTSSRKDPEESDDRRDALQNTASPRTTLQDYLIDQLRVLEFSAKLRRIAENIIYNLDRDGRLAATLDEIAATMDEPVEVTEVEEALRAVQSLDPTGVAARDLKECLLLQLDPLHPDAAIHRCIIEKHLEDLEHNRLPKMAKELGVSMERTKELAHFIASLHPAPGRLYNTERVPYIVPDVIVESMDGRYEVYLNETYIPRVRLNPTYLKMACTVRKGSQEHEFLKKKIDSARWLVDAVRQRKETLLKIAHEIVRMQPAFLEKGLNGLRPLKMQEVADAAHVHVSTVSRAINQKYMQTPWGLYSMKFFFSGGTQAADGEAETWNALKERIKELIDHEDKASPLSDEEIVAKLAGSGLDIARRTVTKYRKIMNIASSRERKQY